MINIIINAFCSPQGEIQTTALLVKLKTKTVILCEITIVFSGGHPPSTDTFEPPNYKEAIIRAAFRITKTMSYNKGRRWRGVSSTYLQPLPHPSTDSELEWKFSQLGKAEDFSRYTTQKIMIEAMGDFSKFLTKVPGTLMVAPFLTSSLTSQPCLFLFTQHPHAASLLWNQSWGRHFLTAQSKGAQHSQRSNWLFD